LPGTIHSVAEEIEKAGGKALACVVDIRNVEQIQEAVDRGVAKFGGIDIVVNNASAISLTGTAQTSDKVYDLMHNINTRGTYMTTKTCLPHLLKSSNPHVLMLSPPINLNPKWFKNHAAYTIAKYGMSLCVLGMAEEFRKDGIAVNALWPLTSIATSAVKNILGGDELMQSSRTPEILSDCAHIILTSDSKTVTGNFFIDEELLRKKGVTNFDKYLVNPANKDKLFIDFFLDKEHIQRIRSAVPE